MDSLRRRLFLRRVERTSRGHAVSENGAALFDLCAGLALSAAATATVLSGVGPLTCAVRVEAARTTVVDTLLEARRRAYESETSVSVDAHRGGEAVFIKPSGAKRSLGTGVLLMAAPSDGTVQFRASGLADNATLTLGCGSSSASVVVNQRGVIR